MSAKSEYTKTLCKQYWLYLILDWTCLFAPTIIYVFIALFSTGVTTTGKVSVVGTVLIAGILTIFNIIMKKRLTCIIWITCIGLYIAFTEYLLSLVIIMAVTSAIHDFILAPLVDTYKVKKISAKTDDDRKAFESRE